VIFYLFEPAGRPVSVSRLFLTVEGYLLDSEGRPPRYVVVRCGNRVRRCKLHVRAKTANGQKFLEDKMQEISCIFYAKIHVPPGIRRLSVTAGLQNGRVFRSTIGYAVRWQKAIHSHLRARKFQGREKFVRPNADFPIKRLLESLDGARMIYLRRLHRFCKPFIRRLNPVMRWCLDIGPIRFQAFTYPERLGHFVANTEVYLSEKEAGLHEKKSFDIWILPSRVEVENLGSVDVSDKISNRQVLEMWKRKLHVSSFFSRHPGFLDFFRDCFIRQRLHGHRDINGVLDRTQPHLEFTRKEEDRGRDLLKRMGVPDGARYVCFHNREPDYLSRIYPASWNFTLANRRYAYRDARLDACFPSMEMLAERGFYVLRMGVGATDEMKTSHPRIIDYAAKFRDEFADVYLTAGCHFFAGSTSGIYALPSAFRKPVVFVNFAPMAHVHAWSSRELTIFKLLYSDELNRLLRFDEILSLNSLKNIHGEQLSMLGLRYIDNTADEIRDAVLEMVQRLEGGTEETMEDALLQKRFWSQVPVNELNLVFRSRIGTSFLKKYQHLLGPDIPDAAGKAACRTMPLSVSSIISL